MKVLSISSAETIRRYHWLVGEYFLYPEGTIRIIEKCVWFKKRILKQVASESYYAGTDGVISDNSWKTIEIINAPIWTIPNIRNNR